MMLPQLTPAIAQIPILLCVVNSSLTGSRERDVSPAQYIHYANEMFVNIWFFIIITINILY